MARSTRAWLVASLVLPLALAGGCRSGQEKYCDAVRSHRSELGELMGGDPNTALLRALPVFEDLQDHAPQDIRDDWRLVVTAVKGLRDALDAAHVDASTYDRDKPPAGVSRRQRQAIDAAAAGLTTPTTVRSFAAVQQEALDVCQSPLYL